MNATAIWKRTVDVRTDRKKALWAAMRELPLGVTLDLVVHHQGDCLVRELAEYAALQFCTCPVLTLEARRLP